ncbi:MAG: glycosyltransferase family 39 protein [Burkholderiales bacterium]|nr:glycosyltransferase family 39 protein [Anaerolineae bacterium]
MFRRGRVWLGVILVVALALRLIYALTLDPSAAYQVGNEDSGWYLEVGRQLVLGQSPAPLPTSPLYPLLLGFWQIVLPPDAAVIAVRLLQTLLSVASCYLAYRLGTLVWNERAGILAAGVLALSPVFIIEAAQITTETLYIFLLLAGLLAYVSGLRVVEAAPRPYKWFLLLSAAMLFALATLTRAVVLLFPLGLAIHLLMVYGWRRGWKRALMLLVVYALVVSVWTAHNWIKWRRVVIGAEGFAAFAFLGTSEQGWQGFEETDAALAEEVPEIAIEDYNAETQGQAFAQRASQRISSDPLGWLRLRFSNVAESYLQPHGTTYFPGESLKALAENWWQNDRTLGGLAAVITGDAFWPKLLMYGLHFGGLVLGAIGMIVALWRKRWREALPLIGFVVYTTLLHLALLALPRYIFPTEPIWWIFAAGLVTHLFSLGRNHRGNEPTRNF